MKTLCAIKQGSLKDKDQHTRGKLEVCEFPDRDVGPEDVKVKVAYCAICGSDPHIVEGIFGPITGPRGLGHEVSGVVVELGSQAGKSGLKVGDRIGGNPSAFCGTCYYCQNGQQQFCPNIKRYKSPGMSEYVVWHESMVHKLPPEVGLKKGCLLEPVSIAVRMVDKACIKIGQRVAVCGGGPIGQLVLQCVKRFGATSLTMIEPVRERRGTAARYGAEFTIDPSSEDVVGRSMEITRGLGFDVVIDCSGSARAVGLLPQIAAKGGLVEYGSMYPDDFEMPVNLYQTFFEKELTFTGCFLSPYSFPRAVQMLKELDLDEFIREVYPLSRGPEAFDEHAGGKCLKILIQCNEDLQD
ncbi:zinc-dependent alcohol dehydrogenase [Enterocloster citroniae]|uniref:zinc-dependent alcohol dehydrogenase n=1 Tax=Enterocloster citroniae TaxID=358743 RepID=UPI0018970A3C|nr:alcohol dehydrogenase catalytic domain-containing protein [Enterocloster citroniae]